MVRTFVAFLALALAAVVPAGGAFAQGGRLKAIAAGKAIKIAHRTDAVPFSFIDGNKNVAGYTVDICKAVVTSLAHQLKIPTLNIAWVPVSTQDRFSAVAAGKADLECGASTVTLARMKEVDFSNYVFVESTGIAVGAKAAVDKLADLAGKKIAVIAGTSNEKVMAAKNREMKLGATLVQVASRDEAVAALEGGNVDAFASDKLLLYGAQFKDPRALRALSDDLSIEPYAIVLPRGDWELRLAVNTALAELYRNGEVEKIFGQWFGSLGLQPGSLLKAVYMLGAVAE
ncbi:MAG TPA: amino acid ABC transporter substrate-binding protein [Xanthobacteraceae bacterium]|nr:amino acid ABC transporter substrate-binding protein [Xanthobacteraceae bacterium]